MDERYQHPQVTELWSLAWTYGAWWRIEQAIVRAQASRDLIPMREASPLIDNPVQPLFTGLTGSQHDIRRIEQETRHAVVPVVRAMREWWGEPHGRWIHFGVTSSDIVDTAQALRFKALGISLRASLVELRNAISKWTGNQTVVVGRTHGQPAEPTTIGIRAVHWQAHVHPVSFDLERAARSMEIAKVSGPVGTFAHNPPEVEKRVAIELGLLPMGVGASQVIPRTYLAQWASLASLLVQACNKIAVDLRLMSMLGEAQEPKAKGQVGSSSMAHKTNPIRAEKIGGMARLAAGYASMLQPVDLWLERDISSSSVERVAVPDLWHVLLHTIEQTTELLNRTQPDYVGIGWSFDRAGGQIQTARVTSDLIREGYTAEQARQVAVEQTMVHPLDARRNQEIPEDTAWFTRNYPGAVQ